jgi:hypothetical protein
MLAISAYETNEVLKKQQTNVSLDNTLTFSMIKLIALITVIKIHQTASG